MCSSRRTRLAQELPRPGGHVAPRVAAILGPELGWGVSRQALEVEMYLASARREFAVAPPDAREPAPAPDVVPVAEERLSASRSRRLQAVTTPFLGLSSRR